MSQQRKLKLEIPANLSAVYSNGVIVSQTNNEIVFDFIQILPNDPRARIQSRVIMTPAGAKSFLRALEQQVENYESKHGEITLPPTLADQLFSNIRSEEDDEHE
ncbi:MAG: DUF3467 domain-containing protein [Anaerolineae bacterium]|nr:DUF3467 domain-containing protein [Anaerolineae bacterium]